MEMKYSNMLNPCLYLNEEIEADSKKILEALENAYIHVDQPKVTELIQEHLIQGAENGYPALMLVYQALEDIDVGVANGRKIHELEFTYSFKDNGKVFEELNFQNELKEAYVEYYNNEFQENDPISVEDLNDVVPLGVGSYDAEEFQNVFPSMSEDLAENLSGEYEFEINLKDMALRVDGVDIPIPYQNLKECLEYPNEYHLEKAKVFIVAKYLNDERPDQYLDNSQLDEYKSILKQMPKENSNVINSAINNAKTITEAGLYRKDLPTEDVKAIQSSMKEGLSANTIESVLATGTKTLKKDLKKELDKEFVR